MSKVINYILIAILLIVIIILSVHIAIHARGKVEEEKFTTPNYAWNDAASYTNRPNYLLSTNQNQRIMKETPGYLPSRNSTRGVLPMNNIAPSKDAVELPDANSTTGYRNIVSFPGPINPTKLPKETKEWKEAEEIKDEKKQEISIPGTNFKPEKITYDDNAPIVKQKPSITNENDDVTFSTNSRVNATTASIITPNESKANDVIQSFMVKKAKKI